MGEQHWDYQPHRAPRLGHCSIRLADEVATRTGIGFTQALELLEDLAREFPEHVMIKDPGL